MKRFGDIACERGLATQDQVALSVKMQDDLAKQGIEQSLGSIMHDLGILDLLQVRQVVDELDLPAEKRQSIPGYRVKDIVGTGTSGTVYLGTRLNDDYQVAIKVMAPELSRDPASLKRFFLEARTVARLDHPNVVQALDFGSHLGYHYLIMRYVEGQNLAELLEEQGALRVPTALRIAEELCQALLHFHQEGYVHRDITPSNVIVDGDGQPVLCDLGLVKPLDAQKVDPELPSTAVGLVLGTPYYLAPEQARGDQPVDGRTDIYGLGATLYHMLSGEPPVLGTYGQVLERVINGQIRPLTELRPTLPSPVVELVGELMAQHPEDRPANALTVSKQLRILQRSDGGARRSSWWRRLWGG